MTALNPAPLVYYIFGPLYRKSELDITFMKAAKFVSMMDLEDFAMLQFYGFFKQAIVGNCNRKQSDENEEYENQKILAWEKNRGISKKEAKKSYIKLVREGLEQNFEEALEQLENDIEPSGRTVSRFAFGEAVEEENQTMRELKEIIERDDAGELKHFFASQNEFNVNYCDSEGQTLLHWAVDNSAVHIIKLLRFHKADPNIKDNEGNTPLHYAILLESEDVITEIFNFPGIDWTTTDEDGNVYTEICDLPADIKEILLKAQKQ